MFRRLFIVALLTPLFAFAQDVVNAIERAARDVELGEYAFLSWYSGWTRHDILGIGAIEAPYSGAVVECGGRLIPLRPIYDSHAERLPPTPEQSQGFAEAYNLAVLRALESRGVRCAFELLEAG